MTRTPEDPLVAAIVTGSPTAEEVAASSAVLGLLAEAQREQVALAVASPAASAWSRSQRVLRSTLRPGPGAWRSFSA